MPYPPPGTHLNPEIEYRSSALQVDYLPSEPPEKRKVPTGEFYLWTFYIVPFVYISLFEPVPYCLDDCSFVVLSEVRKVDSSSSFFFLKIALAVGGLLCLNTNCETFCSSELFVL